MGTTPVFIRSNTTYESYTDFWSLVELSGFPIVPSQAADLLSGETYIWPTMDWETIERLSKEPCGKRGARVIWWYLERPDAHRRGMTPEALFETTISEVLGTWVDEVWVSERSINRLDSRTRHVVLGGHPGLRHSKPALPNRYDVAHLGQISPRRAWILTELKRLGLSVSPSVWGPDRDEILESSTSLINIDRVEGMHLSAPLRFVLAAAHRIPILTEKIEDPHPLVAGEGFLESPYASLPAFIAECLRGKDLRPFGENAYRMLCIEHTFEKGVRGALA